jgi:hypothetical protein
MEQGKKPKQLSFKQNTNYLIELSKMNPLQTSHPKHKFLNLII